MRAALAVGLTMPPGRDAGRVVATLGPVAERCAAAGWRLWLRAWPSGAAADAWVVLAALLQRVPGLTAGVVASFPPATRVSDIEDLLVLDNLSGGRVELAFAPDASPEAVDEVRAALRGEALRRADAAGTSRDFLLTPRPARGTLATWGPLPAGTPAAVATAAAAPGGDAPAIRVVDAGAAPSVADAERLMRGTPEDRG